MKNIPYSWITEAPDGDIIIDPTITIQPTSGDGKDNFIYKSSGGDDNYGASGGLQVAPDRGSFERRGLLQFDLSSIPETAAISTAELKLYQYTYWGDASDFTMEAHKMLVDWAEGSGSSWDNNSTTGSDWHYSDQPNTTTWNADGMQAGTDYNSSVIDDILVDSNSGWVSLDVKTAVEDWVDGTSTNYGLALMSASGDISNYIGVSFYSSDYATNPALCAKLIITLSLDPIASFEYDRLGRPTKMTLANNVEETNTYDSHRGWLEKREYKKDSNNVFYFDATGSSDFDAVGNLKQVDYKYGTGSLQSMEYDYNDLHRMDSFKYGAQAAQSYAYDPTGNITLLRGTSFTYGNDNNQLTSDGTNSYTYNSVGRVTQIGTITLAYDLFGNMTEYDSDDYEYDALNQRIYKKEDTVETYYITSGPQVLAEYNDDDELTAEYIYAGGKLLGEMDPAAGYKFVYQDHLGSTRMLSNADLQRDYYPYGEAKNASGNDDMPYQFSGKELDSGTGLYYFGARYYNPEIGRWLVPDPAGQGFSPYVYCGSNPLNYIDPDGRLFGIDDLFIVAGILIGAYTGGSIANHWQPNPAKWNWNKGSTYIGVVGGGFVGGIAGANLAYGLRTTGVGLTLNDIPLGIIGGTSAGLGGAGYLGYQASLPGFTTSIDVELTGMRFGPNSYSSYDDMDITPSLQNWVNQRITLAGYIQTAIPGYRWWYTGYKSWKGHDWDMKVWFQKNIPNYAKRKYIFNNERFRYDEIGNIGWGNIMANYGWHPWIALQFAGLAQMFDKYIIGRNIQSNPPFGDDVNDSRAIAIGYLWYYIKYY